MWKEFLSSIGIGKAKVDTIVHNTLVGRSDVLRGEIIIHGGTCTQTIKEIRLTLSVRFEDEKEAYHERETHHEVIENIGRITAEKERRISFNIPIESDHPVSDHSTTTVLRTTLEISKGMNAKDEDTIIIT